MISEPLVLTDETAANVEFRKRADGTFYSSTMYNGMPVSLAVRQQEIKANKRTNVKRGRRSNATFVIPVKDSVTGEIDQMSVSVTFNQTNLDNNGLTTAVKSRASAFASQALIDELFAAIINGES